MLFLSSIALSVLAYVCFTGAANAVELMPRQTVSLPTCAQACHDIVLPVFNCDSTTELCFCIEPGIASMVDACVLSNCTYAEQLVSQEFQAKACETPTHDRSSTLLRLSWAMFGLATFFFLGRSTARLLSRNGLHKDDWAIISCYLPLAGAAVCIHTATSADGFGQNSFNLSTSQIGDFLKVYYAFTLLENYILFGTKVTLIFIYLRILPRESLSQAYISICRIFIALLLTTFIATELATIFQCVPISSIWDLVVKETERECLNITTLFRASSALNVVYDVILVFLPIPPLLAISNNNMLLGGQKLGIYSTYFVGAGVIICSMGKLIPSTMTTAGPTNLTWTLSATTIWTILEINLSMIVCCAPALSPLLTIIRSSDGFSITTSSSAEEILDERERRRSGLRSNVLGIQQELKDTRDSHGSPGMHVGVGEKKVAIQHSIPNGATKDKFVYRDGKGEMHEVELIDRPIGTGSRDEDLAEKEQGFNAV